MRRAGEVGEAVSERRKGGGGDDISRALEGLMAGARKCSCQNVVDANAALSKRGFLFST